MNDTSTRPDKIKSNPELFFCRLDNLEPNLGPSPPLLLSSCKLPHPQLQRPLITIASYRLRQSNQIQPAPSVPRQFRFITASVLRGYHAPGLRLPVLAVKRESSCRPTFKPPLVLSNRRTYTAKSTRPQKNKNIESKTGEGHHGTGGAFQAGTLHGKAVWS